MATNAFDALMQDVNQKLSEMNGATGSANGAAARANEAAANAERQAAVAENAAQAAVTAAQQANNLAGAWENIVLKATTLAAGSDATLKLSEANGAKELTVGIPRGADGPEGPKGDPGKSGVTFRREGTKLYITTD